MLCNTLGNLTHPLMVVEYGHRCSNSSKLLHDFIRVVGEVDEIHIRTGTRFYRRFLTTRERNIFSSIPKLLPGSKRTTKAVGAITVIENYRAFHMAQDTAVFGLARREDQ